MATTLRNLAEELELGDGSIIQHSKSKRVYIYQDADKRWYDLEKSINGPNEVNQDQDAIHFEVIRRGSAKPEFKVGDIVKVAHCLRTKLFVPSKTNFVMVVSISDSYVDVTWYGETNQSGNLVATLRLEDILLPDKPTVAKNVFASDADSFLFN